MRIGTRICAFMLTMLLVVSLGGCIGVDIDIGGATGAVRAEGNIVTREIPVDAFSQVQLLSSIKLVYKSGECGVALTTYENFFDHMTFEVRDGILFVSTQKQFIQELGNDPVLTVTAPTLSALCIVGSVEMEDSDPIRGDSLYLEIMGSADAELSLDVASLNVIASGSADLDFSGTASDVTIQCSGSAEIDALELATERVIARIDGSADLTISCSERLEVDISGAGTVVYRGNPELVQRISGAGGIRQIA